MHHAGTTDRPSIIYPGLSGVILRAPNLYHDARSSNHEPYNMLDHNISVSMNPDRPDRPSIRVNETLNPPPTVYILTYPAYPYDSAIYPGPITQPTTSPHPAHPTSKSSGRTLSYSPPSKSPPEPPKGIHRTYSANYHSRATNTTPNDHPMTNQSNSHRRVYNSGDSTAMSGPVDSASGSVDS